MSEPQLIKIQAKRAAEVCARVTLDESSREIVEDEMSPGAFINALLAREAFVDAIRFLAYALPKREAIWWACLCAREALPPQPESELTSALQIAETWVYKPSDENQRAALSAGEKIGTGTAAGWTALAAGWSGGSLGPPTGPVIAPGDNLSPAAVAVAIVEAAAADPGNIQDHFRRYLASGIDIASGGTGRRKAKSA